MWWLVPPHLADHNLHILNLMYQLHVPQHIRGAIFPQLNKWCYFVSFYIPIDGKK